MPTTLAPDPPPATVTIVPDPPRAGATAIGADPGSVDMAFAIDPDDIVGGIFDRRVFDGFKPNYVFDTAAPSTRLLPDPIVGELVTIPDPVTA
jgi:hypothetical protein